MSAFEAQGAEKPPRVYGQGRVPLGGEPETEIGGSSLPLKGRRAFQASHKMQVPPMCMGRSLAGDGTEAGTERKRRL